MKKFKGFIIILFICIGHSLAQEYIPIDPGLTRKQDELLNQQAEVMLNKADEVLSNFPPQIPEPLERTLALYLLDGIFHDVYAPQRPPVQEFLQHRMDNMADQMDNTEVEEGAIIWKLYSHSFVVRTPSVTIAFDLIRPSVRFDTFYTDTRAMIGKIIEQCDVLFISHWHPDHADEWVARAFMEQGKPVVAPPDVWKVDILNSVNEMDSNNFHKAMGSTSSRVPAGSCCRLLLQFARQAISVCPTVRMSHWFSRQFLVLNDIFNEISLFNLKIFVPLYPALAKWNERA